MINALLNGILSLITSLINLLLSPIDALIKSYLPGLDEALSSFSAVLNLLTGVIGWVISTLGLPSTFWTLLIAYFTFKLTVPFLISTVKLCIKWYNALKP